jgi:hypothetical protein
MRADWPCNCNGRLWREASLLADATDEASAQYRVLVGVVFWEAVKRERLHGSGMHTTTDV